jgi:NAD(P)-dependent dehydrogenase (short-subunit alcohol dehydrogenase family)
MADHEKAVVITGASTGIGRATALYLDELGFRVYAGVRRERDGEALKEGGSPELTPILLDVTEEDSITAGIGRIRDETDGRIFGLINNAGLSMNGPLELVSVSQIRALLEVNVIGLLAVTKTLIPLLRRDGGRIINISSGHGLLAVPDKSVYAASKFAVQAISDSLRTELRPFDISVSNVVVGKVETAVLGKILEDRETLLRESDPEIVDLYRPLLEFFDREVKNLPGILPAEVAKVVAQALGSRKPKPQYLIGPGAKKMKYLARLPVGMRDRMMYRAIYGTQTS